MNEGTESTPAGIMDTASRHVLTHLEDMCTVWPYIAAYCDPYESQGRVVDDATLVVDGIETMPIPEGYDDKRTTRCKYRCCTDSWTVPDTTVVGVDNRCRESWSPLSPQDAPAALLLEFPAC